MSEMDKKDEKIKELEERVEDLERLVRALRIELEDTAVLNDKLIRRMCGKIYKLERFCYGEE